MMDFFRILIVEDEYVIRQGLKYLVNWESEGFQVVGECQNGREALDQIESLKPHIVITDIVMPLMDGIEFTSILQKEHPEIRIVILSGYSDFEYVKTSFLHGAVDYILKPTLNPADLLATLKKAAGKLSAPARSCDASQETLLCQCLSGYGGSEGLELLRGRFPHDRFFLLGMDVPYVFGGAGELPKQAAALNGAAAEFFPSAALGQAVADSRVLLLLVNYGAGTYPELSRAAERLVERLPGAFYVCTPEYHGLARLRDAYQNSLLPFVRQRFYHREAAFLKTEQFKTPPAASPFDSRAYLSLLRDSRLTEALSLLKETVLEAVNSRSIGEFDLKSLTQNALYQILSFWEEIGLDPDNLAHLKRNCFMRISEAKYAEDFESAFHLILADFEEIIQKYRVDPEKQTMRKILSYISQHYAEPLTLNELAQRFSFNYSYLSSYFSAHNPEGFSEYLNRERIQRAEELLRAGDYSVSEVSGRVGYYDHSYFCKVFKKFTGKTPSEMRRESARMRKGEGS